jgi:hypothetical protein
MLELSVRARDVLNELAIYMAKKALDAGATLPPELQRHAECSCRVEGSERETRQTGK